MVYHLPLMAPPPLLLPQRDHRIIDTSVPKIPKMPVELRMLTYTEDNTLSSGSGAPRLLSSGASSSTSQFDESETNSRRDQQQQEQQYQQTTRRQSHPSAGSSGSGRRRGSENHVYKPFKQERGQQQQQANAPEMPAYEESYDNEYDETEDYYDSNQTNQTQTNKNYNSFFMTQVSNLSNTILINFV